MTLQSKPWKDIQAQYLNKVEKALSSVKHPHMAEVVEDVRSHLDQRFKALGPDEQTRENLQAIITQMGPASDYAELLSQGTTSSPPENAGQASSASRLGHRTYCSGASVAKIVVSENSPLSPPGYKHNSQCF